MKEYSLMILGTFFFAFSVSIFAMPNSLAEGGVVGLALLLYFGLGWSPTLVTLIANGVILLIGYRYLPKSMIVKSIITVPLFSFFLFLLADIANPIDDPLLAALYTGVFTGIGFGFIFRSGSTMSGTSTIAKMLNYKFGLELTGTNFVLDTLVVLAGILVIGPLLTMYTVVALFIGKRVTDYVLEGFESKKIVHIFSNQHESIARSIQKNLGAHATILQGKNYDINEEENLVYVVVKKQQLFFLKKLIREIDIDAFTVVHTVKDVSGGSFNKAHYPTQVTFSSEKEEKKFYKEQAED
ncbi:YitT family protein [Alkalicoccobacillus plakortidis]|uniref:YitT family protein n=1 Tax=Alkalicoccobacillus plakortidis TaxID=444060 RepID=A0ABT0XHW9_9BACI|nr:YitT family protein [Alkalicoccobacillus plakortidis]MCM2675484.1 YitT family protein [Alkalicoccobacillus plakortidis]